MVVGEKFGSRKCSKKRRKLEPTEAVASVNLLSELVECPVCMAGPRRAERIYACRNGHVVCNACRRRDELERRCPVCRCECGMGSRNLVAERALDEATSVRHPCRNPECQEAVPLWDLADHESKRCGHRTVRCPGGEFGGCRWSGPLPALEAHANACAPVAVSYAAPSADRPHCTVRFPFTKQRNGRLKMVPCRENLVCFLREFSQREGPIHVQVVLRPEFDRTRPGKNWWRLFVRAYLSQAELLEYTAKVVLSSCGLGKTGCFYTYRALKMCPPDEAEPPAQRVVFLHNHQMKALLAGDDTMMLRCRVDIKRLVVARAD